MDPLVMVDAVSFSPLLGCSFRSDYERLFAETLCLSWHWRTVVYEPYTIPVTSRRTYTPDFYLPRPGVWFEVKGEWRNGAKKKFLTASQIIGENHLILIPPTYRKWFVREEKVLHRGLGI
jgi:predicted nuclease of restriction endonuclease-like RecB superfamily